MPQAAIVFSCDEQFSPLAKGLVLSLRQFGAPNANITLNLIDIGCSAETLAWMEQHGVHHRRYSHTEHYSFAPGVEVLPYHDSLLCRPMIPQLFPDHDVYVFIDADIWVQEAMALQTFLELPGRYRDTVVIAPCVDYSYSDNYIRTQGVFNAVYRTYLAAYDQETAAEYAFRPFFSCGMFAMARECPLWGMWKDQLDVVFNKNYFGTDKHGVEQLAMNYLIYKTKKYIPVDSIFNYQCHVGAARRDARTGKVIIAYPPNRTIGAIHLTATGHFIRQYMELGLLYDRGNYLSEQDRHTLLTLDHAGYAKGTLEVSKG